MAKIGFIGLGAMGRHMSSNLIKAGHELKVYDLMQPAVDELVAKGATAAANAKEAATGVDVVITMLPNSPHVEAALTGPEGIFAGLESGKLIIDMTSLAATAAKKFYAMAKERGIDMLDAPVTGGTKGAMNGTLTILVGGEQAAFDKALPILQGMGKNIRLLGGPGAGQTVKMVNQIMVGITVAAIAEAWTIGVKCGADPMTLIDMLSTGSAGNFQMSIVPNTMLANNFEPGFMVDLQYKDLGIAMDVSREVKVPLALTSTAFNYYEMARAMGYGRKDHSAVALVLRDITGVDITAPEKKQN